MFRLKQLAATLVTFVGSLFAASAFIIAYDSSVDVNKLSGAVTMSVSGSTLTIVLQNTSDANAGTGAPVLLTGVGFALPGGIGITGGSVTALGSRINFPANWTFGDNVSSQWGYDNDPLQSGVLKDIAGIRTVVSAMESQVDTLFTGGDKAVIDGPGFGLLSVNADPSVLGNGLPAVQSSVQIDLTLSGSLSTEALETIKNGPIALSFGSPNAIPDGGTTVLLLGAALAALGGFARRFRG